MDKDLKEGDVVTRLVGNITKIEGKERSTRHQRRAPNGARICVRTERPGSDGDDYEDEFYYDVPEEHVGRLRIGQEIAVEIKVLK